MILELDALYQDKRDRTIKTFINFYYKVHKKQYLASKFSIYALETTTVMEKVRSCLCFYPSVRINNKCPCWNKDTYNQGKFNRF